MSPQDTAPKKPEVKRSKASTMEEQWVVVSARKNLWKQKPKPEVKKPKHARLEAVLIKPPQEVSYADILKDFKQRVKSDEFGVAVQGIREIRSKDLLVKLKCFKEGGGRFTRECVNLP